MPGELKKLRIEAYDDIRCEGDHFVDEFYAMFNPSTYSEKYEIEYSEDQAQGTSGSTQNFGKMKPQEYTFEFLFDGTGTAAEWTDVTTEVDWFLALAYEYNGEMHRPYFLKIHWGRLVVRCILKTATVTYTLFDPDGFPIRAKINGTFSEVNDDELRTAAEGRNSPDLTHYRKVKDGDNLPLMCHRIYGDMRHYLEVADFNGLTDFRTLETGSMIAFPPLVKLEEIKAAYA